MFFEEHFDDVGPGWRPILESLNACFQYAFRAGYKGQEAKREALLKIIQVKEKFGGLRIYLNHTKLPHDLSQQLADYIMMAEAMSFTMCEQCGAVEGTERRSPNGPGRLSRSGWVKTYCPKHHAERDADKGRKKGL